MRRASVGGDLHVGFEGFIHLAGAVAVPEIGDVAVLLGLGQGVLGNAGSAQHLGQGVLDNRGLHQIIFGDVQVAVILQHTGKLDTGVAGTVELVEVLPVEGQGDLLGTVAAEVEQDDGVAVGDLCNRLTVPGHHESGQVLVDAAGLGTVGLNSLSSGSKLTAQALNVGSPALFHHGPVGFVAVHGDLHTAAAGSDGIVAALGGELLQNIFQHLHIFQSGSGGHITAVQQDVAVGLLDTLGMSLLQQGDQVADVGVDVAVGQQAHEVHGLALSIGNQVLPGSGCVQGTVLDAFAHQLGTLRVDLTAAQCVVADFGVAHIVIAGQTDSSAVGLQPGIGAGSKQVVQSGGVGNLDSIAAAAVTLADTIHDYQNNGFFHEYYLQKRVSSHNFCILTVVLFYIIFKKLTTLFLFFPLPTKKPPGNPQNK